MTKSCCTDMHVHPDYSGELSRLNRIAGQVEGVKKMIQERRYCPDIITQLRAIRSAVNAIEANILDMHLDSCVTDVFQTGNEGDKKKKLEELKELYRKYNV